MRELNLFDLYRILQRYYNGTGNEYRNNKKSYLLDSVVFFQRYLLYNVFNFLGDLTGDDVEKKVFF